SHPGAFRVHRDHGQGALGHPHPGAGHREPRLRDRPRPGRLSRARSRNPRAYHDRGRVARGPRPAAAGLGGCGCRREPHLSSEDPPQPARPHAQDRQKLDMTKIEPTSLDIAKATLLAPFGLDERATDSVFGTILAHRADDADLFFQYNRSEGWTLEEGQVKSGSFSIDQGVGVRVVAGEKTAFAY